MNKKITLSNYVFKYHEEFAQWYGGDRDDYIKQSEEAASYVEMMIHSAIARGKNLQQLFHQLLLALGQKRRQIANEHGTAFAQKFGSRREGIIGHSTHAYTHLYNQYVRYNEQALQLLSEKISDYFSFKAQKKIQKDEVYLGYEVSFTLEIFEPEDLARLGWDKTHTDSEVSDILDTLPERIHVPSEVLTYLQNDVIKSQIFSAIKILKEMHPDYYESERMNCYLMTLERAFPSPSSSLSGQNPSYLKNLYVLGGTHIKINGTSYTLSQQLTWMYKTHEENPLERMRHCSTVLLIHSDACSIEELLKEVAKSFENAIHFKGDLSELKNKIGLFVYLLVHTMPFLRGSAAIALWLEAALYQYHGFEHICYADEYLLDLEVMISPSLSDFLKKYPSMIEAS